MESFPSDWEDPDIPVGENPDFPGQAGSTPTPSFTPQYFSVTDLTAFGYFSVTDPTAG